MARHGDGVLVAPDRTAFGLTRADHDAQRLVSLLLSTGACRERRIVGGDGAGTDGDRIDGATDLMGVFARVVAGDPRLVPSAAAMRPSSVAAHFAMT
ncbi:hypothetical protein GCM10025876_38500 [Demequina litorisediminis]|uniref:Uncharacterized protein n=1 Tax=Demequina litorisediminis TaxID=1849022 RepID=A0ABQ6IIV1_9MICO|nr:hypothetical protein GCM10025876_38500 [Demequina litorisediminis]